MIDADGSGQVVHCWADLQSVHGFRCYDNIVPNVKCQRVHVIATPWSCGWFIIIMCKELPDIWLQDVTNKNGALCQVR